MSIFVIDEGAQLLNLIWFEDGDPNKLLSYVYGIPNTPDGP